MTTMAMSISTPMGMTTNDLSELAGKPDSLVLAALNVVSTHEYQQAMAEAGIDLAPCMRTILGDTLERHFPPTRDAADVEHMSATGFYRHKHTVFKWEHATRRDMDLSITFDDDMVLVKHTVQRTYWGTDETAPLQDEFWMIDDELFHRTDGAAVTRYHDNGQMHIRHWFIRGVEHCNGVEGPSYEAWGYDGTKETEHWKRHNKFHRTNGPALSEWHENGTIATRVWYLNGKRHAENAVPAESTWREDGTLRMQRWFRYGKPGREGGGPTLKQYHKDGKTVKLCMWQNAKGDLHSHIDMPAMQSFAANGDLEYECFYRNGEKHRHDGPAELLYRNGCLDREVWHYRGAKTDKETVERLVNKRIRY